MLKFFLTFLFFGWFLTMGYCFPSYNSICSKMSDQRSWKSENCEGMNMQGSPMGQMVTATKVYRKGDKEIQVMVMSGMNAMGYWSQFQGNMQIDTSDQFFKIMNIKGYNIAISFYKHDRSGGIVIPFGSKTAHGEVKAIMVFNFNNMDWHDALEFAKNFDWSSIEDLFN